MSTIRFTLFAIGLFTLTFAGISWASKGFPLMAMRAQPVKPDAPITPAEESVRESVGKAWENSNAVQGDGDPTREALRLALLQAANAFAVSPCDTTMKSELMEALAAYTRAWTDMAGCKSGICGGGDRKIDTAATNFSTPSDMRVRNAVRMAFDKGGISRDDFPGSIRLWVTMLAGDPGDPISACATGRRADSQR
jgi:hypothetical protein